MKEKKRVCECGCGKEFVVMTSWQRFYSGHRDRYHNRIKRNKRLTDKNNEMYKRYRTCMYMGNQAPIR